VDAVGPKHADIFILGEAPGAQELGREPFVGPAGKELDKLLVANGIARSDCYITNTIKTFLGGADKEATFFQGGAPSFALMDGIIELVEELTNVKPNVVAAVGDYALWAMTQLRGITSYRGSILESTLRPGQKIVPVIHPAWFLHTREWHKLPLTEWDWGRIKEQSKFPEIKRVSHHFTLNPTQEQLNAAAETLLASDHITVDTEWHSPESLAYIQFTTSNRWAIAVPAEAMMAYRFYKKILSSDVPKWMQNAMFDVPALYRIGIEVVNMEHDTMIAWNATFGDIGSKALATISSVLTEEPYYKDEGQFVGGKEDERGQQYGCLDVIVTDESMNAFLDSEFSIWGTRKGYDITMDTMDVFLMAAKTGTLCDIELLKKKRAEKIASANEREDALSERVGYTINCRSSQQICALVYDQLGVKRDKRSSAQDHLMDIAASSSDSEVCEILLDIIRVRRDRNVCSRYLNENIIDVDGRIRCNWNLAGTKNGRLSTTKPWWNGVAVQTFPYDIRDVFIADPGHVFVGWDLEQAEARVVAHLTNDWDLLENLAQGIDIHTHLASQMPFGMTYEDLLKIIEVVGKDECDERYLAKKCRHAMNYYLTWTGLKKAINKEWIDTQVGVTAARAKELRASYITLSPGLETWWHEVYLHIREHKYMVNAYGRRRNFFGRLTEREHLHRDGIAYFPQSSVHDSTLLAIAELSRTMEFGQILADMHDGGYALVPEELADDAVHLMCTATTREMLVNKEVCVIPTEIKVGADWKHMEVV
jgi:uracil-DNA glycosylase family 4